MADTVVSYVLNVNTQQAQKGLDRTGKEAEETSRDFNKLSQSTDKLSQSTERLARASKSNRQGFKNLRRAGRDLDGSFGDLAQGVGLFNPQLAGMFQTLSDGASIAEGVGRTLVGALNPAMLTVLGTTLLVGGAFYVMHKEQEEAKARAEALKKAIEDTNKTIAEQQKILEKTTEAFTDYIIDVNETGNQLALLTGSISQYDYETAKATQTAEEFKSAVRGTYEEEQAALNESIQARKDQARAIRIQVAALEEQRKIEQSLSQKLGGQAPQFKEMGLEERNLRNQLKTQEDLIAKEEERLAIAQKQIGNIVAQGNQIEENLTKIAQIKEQRRQEAEQERKNAAYRSRIAKEEAERQKELDKQKREQERKQQEALRSQQALENLIYTLNYQQATERQKINMNLNKQLVTLKELESTGANSVDVVEAERLLREQALNDLNEITKRERLITAEKEKQAEEEKKKTEEKEKQAKLDKVSAGISAGSTLASGDIGSMLSLISPIAGQFASALIEVGQKTPAERKEELMQQVEALKLGLSFLPEIFLSVLPQVALALTEAIIDGISLFFQNLVNLIKSIFTLDRGSRQERRERRSSFISDFFDPSKSATFQGGGRFLASAMGGIRYTGEARSGLAMLHQGEYVVPRTQQAPQQVQRDLAGAGSNININISSIITEQNAIDKLVREIERRFNSNYGVSQSNLFGGR